MNTYIYIYIYRIDRCSFYSIPEIFWHKQKFTILYVILIALFTCLKSVHHKANILICLISLGWMDLGKQKSGARLKDKKNNKTHVPCGNISALHLRNVKANIVTACCCFFPPFALYYMVSGNGKKMPQEGCRHICVCYMLASEVMCFYCRLCVRLLCKN